MICLCGVEFTPRKNSKTCSPKCSVVLTARRQRAYNATIAHPKRKSKADDWAPRASVYRKINRAVRLLFAQTGENHHV